MSKNGDCTVVGSTRVCNVILSNTGTADATAAGSGTTWSALAATADHYGSASTKSSTYVATAWTGVSAGTYTDQVAADNGNWLKSVPVLPAGSSSEYTVSFDAALSPVYFIIDPPYDARATGVDAECDETNNAVLLAA